MRRARAFLAATRRLGFAYLNPMLFLMENVDAFVRLDFA